MFSWASHVSLCMANKTKPPTYRTKMYLNKHGSAAWVPTVGYFPGQASRGLQVFSHRSPLLTSSLSNTPPKKSKTRFGSGFGLTGCLRFSQLLLLWNVTAFSRTKLSWQTNSFLCENFYEICCDEKHRGIDQLLFIWNPIHPGGRQVRQLSLKPAVATKKTVAVCDGHLVSYVRCA